MTRSTSARRAILAAVAVALAVTIPPPVGAEPDQCILDDLIVDGSACIGFDCRCNSESFGFDTLRLRENNLRVHFDDTSTAAAFPRNDWRIIINDSANGGASYFAVEDATAGRQVFRVEAGARSNALYVDSAGDVGVGTSSPATDIHIVTGNTPTLRLAQDGSSGFTPQTWDLAGNETNFFVRDLTGGSALPLRIRPAAPSNSIFIEGTTGDVGMGTASPEAPLHILTGSAAGDVGTGNAVLVMSRSGSQPLAFQLRNAATGDFWNTSFDTALDAFVISRSGSGVTELRLDSGGDLTISGQCSEGASGTCADYVFEPDYELLELDELAEFIADHRRLPNVPSTEEIRREGVSVQRFQGRLLEKIEELTLYTLQQQETLEAVLVKNRELERRLAEVEGEAVTPPDRP